MYNRSYIEIEIINFFLFMLRFKFLLYQTNMNYIIFHFNKTA